MKGSTTGHARRATLLAAAVLALVSGLVYANALDNGFAMDDEPVIVRNEAVREGEIGRLFTEPHWDNYRPLTLTTYAVEWAVADGDPRLFHATNVLLHAVVTLLLFLLLLRLGAERWAAAAAAALFAVHPVHVEAVAYVVGRAEVLVAAFVLAGLLVHLSDRGRAVRALGIAAAFALAMASKENGVVLPALMVLVTAWRAPTLRAVPARVMADWPSYAAIAGVGIGYGLVRRSVVGTFTLYQQAYGFVLEPAERWMTAATVWPEYLRLLFFPLDLSIDYGPAVLLPARSLGPDVLFGLVAGVAALALVPLLWHRQRWVPLGVAWFALAVFPVSNLLVPVGIWLAERNLYLPSVAVALVAAPALEALLRRRPDAQREATPPEATATPRTALPVPAVALVAALVLAGAWRTWTRTPVWKSSDAALASLMEDHPENYRAQWHMATLLSASGDDARALEYATRAFELTPDYGQVVLEYVRLLGANGRASEAAEVLRERPGLGIRPEWHLYLTLALLDLGRGEEALAVAREGVRLHPYSELAADALARAERAAAGG